jgi:hypothetical protein
MTRRGKPNKNVQRNQIIAAVLGLGISAIFIISLVAPNTFDTQTETTNNTQNNDDELPTTSPATPRVPPTVEPDGSKISMDRPFINTTGLFQILKPLDPAGSWTNPDPANGTPPTNTTTSEVPASTTNNIETGSTLFLSPTRLAVIHATTQFADRYPNVKALEDSLTDSYFNQIWQAYYQWQLTSKTADESFLTYDFILRDAPPSQVSYVARYILWHDNGLINGLRLIVPENNPALLETLQERILPSFVSYPNLIENTLNYPTGWTANTDMEQGYMLKLPDIWRVIEGGEGRPRTSYGFSFDPGPDTPSIRITIQPRGQQPIASLEDAKTWRQAASTSPLTFVGEGETIEQRFGDGYLLHYTYQNEDLDTFTGVMILLNDKDGNLYTAEFITDGNVQNFNDSATHPYQIQGYDAIRTFTLLAPADYANTPEPFPTSFISIIRNVPTNQPRTNMEDVLPGIFATSATDGSPIFGYPTR